MFTPYVAERVGWYVYALRNPVDGRIFYVGKGRGNRVFHHAKDAEGSVDDPTLSPKLELINQIHAQGLEVDTIVLRHGLRSQELAYEVEAAVIDTLETLDPQLENQLFSLTNLVKGHHHAKLGKASTNAVASLFEAEPLGDLPEPVVLFGIPKLWTPSMTDAEVYEATHGWWIVGPRVLRARYAAGVNKNVIRGVYRIHYWRVRVQGDRDWKADDKNSRLGFHGTAAPEMSHLLGKSVKHIPTGGSIRYLNCHVSDPAVTVAYTGSEATQKAATEQASSTAF